LGQQRLGENNGPATSAPASASRASRTRSPRKLTECLDGRNDQVAGEDLAELRGASGPTRESLLQLADEDVAERGRDDEAVQRHLYGPRIDLGTREHVGIEGRIFGGPPDGDAGQMGAKDLLQEAQSPFGEGSAVRPRPRQEPKLAESTHPLSGPWCATDAVKVAQDMRAEGDSSTPWGMLVVS